MSNSLGHYALKLLSAFGFTLLVALIILPLLKHDVETENFFYVAALIDSVAGDESTEQEKLKKLTVWLNHNVRHVTEYPPNRDFKHVPEAIQSGYGNCGSQSQNISEMAFFLGLEEQRLINSPQPEHQVAEIKVRGEWQVYDPDLWLYVERDGRVLSLREIYNVYETAPEIESKRFFEAPSTRLKVLGRDYTVSYPEIPVVRFASAYFWLGYRPTMVLVTAIKLPWLLLSVFALSLAVAFR